MEIRHQPRKIIQNKYNTFGKSIFDQVLKAVISIFFKENKAEFRCFRMYLPCNLVYNLNHFKVIHDKTHDP